jgi:predicted CoA-substrate-specific enzyme activase
VAGIDIGSRFIKLVVLKGGLFEASCKRETGHTPLETCRELFSASGADRIVATGYGRYLMEVFGNINTITEIKAVALGAKAVCPDCSTIIDIGGQDTKVINLDRCGAIADFEMNDRCAAGTGRFLEVMAKALGFNLQEFSMLPAGPGDGVVINSMCTVFAESEVISLIAKGVPRERIAAAVHASVANRVSALVKRHPIGEEVVFAGGCASNECLRSLLEQRLGRSLIVHQQHAFLAAYGAALYAWTHVTQ